VSATRERLEPSDVEATAACVADVCLRGAEVDWRCPAGTLDWTVRETVVHMASTCTFYALHLSGAATSELPITLASVGDPPNRQLINVIEASARVLANVGRVVPPERRGFHDAGVADAEGFLAMGCSEMLVHLTDVAAGIGLGVTLPEEICGRVVDRLYPRAPNDVSRANALLWANGRVGLHGGLPEKILRPWHCAPLDG